MGAVHELLLRFCCGRALCKLSMGECGEGERRQRQVHGQAGGSSTSEWNMGRHGWVGREMLEHHGWVGEGALRASGLDVRTRCAD